MSFTVRDHQLPGTGTAVRDYVPERSAGRPLLWVHGGAFAGGSIDMPESDAVARQLAGAGRHVRTLEYRLAPDFSDDGPLPSDPAGGRYPAAQDDILEAFADLSASAKAFLGGASAGACLAASAAVKLRDDGRSLPVGLVLVYGVFHSGLPVHADAEGVRLQQLTDAQGTRWAERMALNYAGAEELLADPRVFPGQGDPAGLPRTLILDADRDILRASGKRFAEQLRHAAVRTYETIVAGSEHGFLNEPASPHFARGSAEMSKWMKRVDEGVNPP
ncbi:alpha/beta hydrolase fold domain-containing protein [Microbacterium trichothecenolyticum]|uniref:Alpha/beta hydrolase fold domain-containing protein n=1 Tax=Microbacterium ureisolvens TaxID=2781186 RepID=A0ABS7I1C2_9MICO|nr:MULTISPECIES: alpha/beta hydrolase fold domain-containing protein [Microbacterium]MBW9110414.1 alpha/beta hydrolase fold domain-containing protein [Microbacterium ureisolvens]MBW9120519.1 alpha/beta hydrolase fold domain-containing protein [Microbacterium trichothecenolyticum]